MWGTSYRVGDVIERIPSTPYQRGVAGRICRVIEPGRTYEVVYADFRDCVVAFHDSLRPAPAGTPAPPCNC